MISRRTLATRLPLLLASPLRPCPARASGPAGPVLKRGLNLPSWFMGGPKPPPLTGADFAQIRAAGFDHVRIPARPSAFGYAPTADGTAMTISFPEVEAAIALAIDNGLSVDVNIQLEPDQKRQVEEDAQAADRYVGLSAGVARRLAAFPADRVAFEPLNEFPFYHDPAKFSRFQARIHEAVRAALPHATIILGGPMGSGLKGLGTVVPVNDENVIYAFHFYEPFIITHQGVSWGFAGMAIHWFRDLPYPSSLVQPGMDYAPAAPDRDKAAAELADYVAGHWDRAKIADRVRIAADWAKANHARVICNEFGVLRLHIDPDSRYRWIADARAAFEANGIGWSLWCYTDKFGIIDPAAESTEATASAKTGARVFEPAALRALFS
jgi:hypothetical protein